MVSCSDFGQFLHHLTFTDYARHKKLRPTLAEQDCQISVQIIGGTTPFRLVWPL
jgi:hypothetical protein